MYRRYMILLVTDFWLWVHDLGGVLRIQSNNSRTSFSFWLVSDSMRLDSHHFDNKKLFLNVLFSITN
jgi:hypothetical protein